MENIAKQVAEVLGLTQVPNLYDWIAVAVIFILVFYIVLNLFSSDEPKEDVTPEVAKEIVDTTEKVAEVAATEPQEIKVSWADRLVKGL